MTLEHPLVATVRQGSTEDDCLRAQQDADRVEALLTQACAISDSTATGRAWFTAFVREIDGVLAPWRATFPAQPFVAWHQTVQRRLSDRAVEVFGFSTGRLIAPPPIETLTLPMSVRMSGPPSLFGL
jgi:hypothetical protein